MRWEGNRESDNVEDRRDDGGGGGGGPVFGGRSIGIGTIVIALVGGWVLGINPLTILGALSGGAPVQVQQPQGPAHKPPADDQLARFVSTVLADTEDVWREVFRQGGAQYADPKLVLFRGATPTACGTGQSAMGPFYCPADQKVYIDLGFYETLKNQLATTCRTCWASALRWTVRGAASARSNTTICRSSWSCRPIAWPASGRTARKAHARSWSRAMWSRP